MGKDGMSRVKRFRGGFEEEAKQDQIAEWRKLWPAPEALWNAISELTFLQIRDARDGYDRALKEAFEAGSGAPLRP